MDYGKMIRLVFDSKVYNVSSKEKTQFRLVNIYGEYMYPVDVTYGTSDHEIYLRFNDFNNFSAIQIECIECLKMGSPDLVLPAFLVAIVPQNLYPIPNDNEYLELANIAATGEIVISFDGKAYLGEYLELANISTSGTIVMLFDGKAYLKDYLNLNSITVVGQYCDINGIPL